MKKTISRNLTIETKADKIVKVEVHVEGQYDSHFGADADGSRGTGRWHIIDVKFEVPDFDYDGYPISQNEKNEVEKLVGEKVDAQSWDFGSV